MLLCLEADMSVNFCTSAVLAYLLFAAAGDVSMRDQTISGDILDPRVAACGIRIGDGARIELQPFLEASEDVSGKFSLTVTKKMPSGTSTSNHASSFSGGRLGQVRLGFDRPATVAIRMAVNDRNGTLLCQIDTTMDLDVPKLRT